MKNKKIFLILVIVASMLLALGGCNNPNKIDKFFKELEKADSYTLKMEMEAPILGKVIVLAKIDGDKSYNSGVGFFDSGEEYREKVDGETYLYKKDDQGKWTKTLTDDTEDEDDSIPFDDDDFANIFCSKSYEYSKSKKKFVLKKDVKADFLEDVEIISWELELKKDICIISAEILQEGTVMPFTITFKDLNNTSITLPEV